MKESKSETALSHPALVETPDDVRALQALSMYGRRAPLPLIQQQLGVSRSTAYRLISRGRELVGLEPRELIPKSIVLMDDLIRESLIEIQQVENNHDLPQHTKRAILGAIRAQINSFVMTQLQAAKLTLAPAGMTTNVALYAPINDNVPIRIKPEYRSTIQMMEDNRKHEKLVEEYEANRGLFEEFKRQRKAQAEPEIRSEDLRDFER